jgi:glucose uptake protein GlcU
MLWLGYVGALVAGVCFGSNYVPLKNKPAGDGLSVQWLMSVAILAIGYAAMFFSFKVVFVWEGIIGGMLWAVGNALVMPAIALVGLGPAFLLWSSGNLLGGWSVGHFGLFGIQKDSVTLLWLNLIGLFISLVSMVLFVCIKPSLKNETAELNVPSEEGEKVSLRVVTEEESTQDGSEDSDVVSSPSGEVHSRLHVWDAVIRRIVGTVVALCIGLIYSVTFVPFMRWQQAQTTPPGPLDFIFTHYSGIFIMSSLLFGIYVFVWPWIRLLYQQYRVWVGYREKNTVFFTPDRPSLVLEAIGTASVAVHVPSAIVGPALLSGLLWGIANAGFMIATSSLGFTVGYPLGVIMPSFVNSFWAVFVFHEIRGARNLLALASALGCVCLAVACFVISKLPPSYFTHVAF